MRLPAPFRAVGEHIAISLPGGHALFTTRRGGVSGGPFASLNLGLTTPAVGGARADRRDCVAQNRARLAVAVGVPNERFAHGHQVHGRHVARVRQPPHGAWSAAVVGNVARYDGQATALAQVAPIVLTADCLPVALIAPGAVAMVHAGWRGLAAGVLDEGLAALAELGAAGPVQAAVGPGVGGCCYEVGDEVRDAFAAHGPQVLSGRRIDLKLIAARQLAAAGVPHVHDVGLCTVCSDPRWFFSHRRDRGVTGRQAGVAWRS